MRLLISIACTLLLCFNASGQRKSPIDAAVAEGVQSSGGRIGVAAKNLATGESIAINADWLFPTASIIKVPVLVELFAQFREGKLSPDSPVLLEDSLKKPGSGILQYLGGNQSLRLLDVATLMIILSDNTATNYVIDRFAQSHDAKLEAVNARMRSLGLHQTKLLNKLYSFATKKKTEEARRFGIGVTTPAEMADLMELLANGRLLNKELSAQMVKILRNQQDMQLAGRLLPFSRDSTLWIGNKTGSLDEVKNDVGIVSSSSGTYVYAIFCDESKDLGEQVDNKATLAVANISRALFDYFMAGN